MLPPPNPSTQVEPYDQRNWWRHAIELPYERGDPEAATRLHLLLSDLMWRTSKKSVKDQLGLPPISEVRGVSVRGLRRRGGGVGLGGCEYASDGLEAETFCIGLGVVDGRSLDGSSSPVWSGTSTRSSTRSATPRSRRPSDAPSKSAGAFSRGQSFSQKGGLRLASTLVTH